MDTYTYPTNAELRLIERELLPTLTNTDPIFRHFPMSTRDAHVIMWEIRDNIRGLQAARGLNGAPERVQALGANRYLMEPGVYGEFMPIDEQELTARRPYGQFTGAMNITDLVRERQDQLLSREVARVRYIIWTLLTTGAINVLNAAGSIVHAANVTVQTYAATVPWSTSATATPLGNFRAVQLLSRGTSTQFDGGATAYMNRTVANELLGNTNTSDLGARLKTAGVVPGLGEMNRILLDQGLPQCEVMDDGYYDDNGTWQQFIPNDTVVVVGRRQNGDPLGEYLMTRNANNENLSPGSYISVVDSLTTGNPVPRRFEVHRGHNGGPAIYYPNGVVVMSV